MAKKPASYKRIDDEAIQEITRCVIDTLREEEASLVQARHDRKRANIKLLLRRYRDIVAHVEDAVYEAIHLEDDLSLQDILELMGGNRRSEFRVDSIRENVATARVIIGHMDRMLESYRESCERHGREEDRRRCRVVHDAFIAASPLTVEEIALKENIDRSTVYRDIDAAADKLAVLFFGVYGLKFL